MHVTTFYHKVIKVRNQKAAGARGVGAGLLRLRVLLSGIVDGNLAGVVCRDCYV